MCWEKCPPTTVACCPYNDVFIRTKIFFFCCLYHDSVVVVVVVVLMILCWCCFSWFVVVRLCLRAAAAAQRLRLAVLRQAVRLQLKASVALIIAFKPINLCDLLQHQLIISLFFSLFLSISGAFLRLIWFVYTAAKEEEEEEEVISTHFFFLFLFIRIFTYYYFPSFNYNSLMKKWALICSIKLDSVGLSSCLLQKKKKIKRNKNIEFDFINFEFHSFHESLLYYYYY